MRVKVVVRPKSGKSEVQGFDEKREAYKVNLKSAPEGGKANLELIKLLRKKFRKEARIVSGSTSREKTVELL